MDIASVKSKNYRHPQLANYIELVQKCDRFDSIAKMQIPVKSRCFCAADLTKASPISTAASNSALVALLLSGAFREDVNRRSAN
ncbi:hypothetical protein [Microcoleus sp. herbarium14]|uniref:hypothetical protein n=1 Tax=Microcoleus sp. herbarium14 TaxID=3055439 RepID=UPI002FCF6417